MVIISDQQVADSPVLAGLSATLLQGQCEALEAFIRSETNNKFHVRESRLRATIQGGKLKGQSDWILEGDRVEILEGFNAGLYNVESYENGIFTLDSALRGSGEVTVYLVRYPKDILSGLLGLLEYQNDPKVQRSKNLSSETISRHSVTYESLQGENAIFDFPARLFGFLANYYRARF